MEDRSRLERSMRLADLVGAGLIAAARLIGVAQLRLHGPSFC
ncbi:MAG: hypothetical protein ACK4L7_05920 [Flavobacteriales bacterium]